MGFTQIIKRNGTVINLNTKEPFCIVKEATQNSSLMGDDYITLKIVSTEWLSFDKGDKIVVDGMDYTIRATTKRDTEAENYYVFEPVFYGPMYDLMKTIYRNTDKDGKSDRSTFDLTYTIKEFVQVLIYNLNRDYPGLWAFDEDNCPETEAKTIQFSGVNCLQALQSLCSDDNFKLEFLITQSNGVRTIHIGKFGQRVNPPGGKEYFEWGKGNGLYKLSEQKIDDKAIITRLWVEGGTNNIRTDYRDYSERLQLPFPKRYNRNRHVLYDGTVVEPNTELIGIDDDSKRYLEDAALKDKLGSEEDTKTYDEIYPTRTGTVTALVADDINSFIDDTMDFDLNEKDGKSTKYLVDGVSAKITFTSGRLAGEQFELNAKGGYDHSKKQFKLIPFTDNRGLVTPTVPVEQGGAFPIEVGATYKITDIFLPESYEQSAEEDLWYAGYNDFKPATQARAQYNLTLDRLYFLEALNRDTEVCVFKVGDYVPVKDTRYGIEKYIRIQKIQRNLLLEQDYQLTLSDTTAISIQTQTVLSVIEHDQVITNNRLRDLTKMRRGWRTTEDLRNMVYDTDGFFDVDNIRPNSIDTNMLTVGSKSQQFVLTGVILQANVGGNPNVFAASDGVLSHLTIDPNGVKAWQMSGQSFTLQSTAGYYLFAKCSKSGTTGTWYISQEQLSFEPTSDPNNYYFLVGVIGTLHSDDNFRDFTTTYGFTRINGNTITTGRIVTSDGECYLDLDGNKFRIGDASSSIDWNVSRSHAITLKNVSVVSESGDVSPLGVYRGVWNENYTYYTNDEVSYTENGATCTYRYIHPQPSKGHKPTESTYWAIVAKGADGKDGVTGDSPALVYRGVYNSSATYYGTAQRVDCVKYNNRYYVARVDAGSFYNVLPTSTNKWNDFGAEFESIATGLLLAENANIANLIFRNERLESSSQSNGVPNFYLDGLNNIASFAAGNVVFDKNSAKIAWLRIVGSDLIGYDASGMERLKFTPNALPAATGKNSTELLTPLSCESENTGTAEIGYDQSGTVAEGFWGSGDIFYSSGRDDRQDEYNLSYWCSVVMNVPNPNVTLFFSDGQFGISDVRDFNNKPTTKGPTLQSATASVSRVNSDGSLTSIGSVDLTSNDPQITIPTACKIKITFTIQVTSGSNLEYWTGKAYVSFQGFPVSTSATETIIAKDGMMAIYNGNYMRMHTNEGFSVKIGNYYFRITSSNGIQKSTNGSTWTNL